ncbi:MAG TPA: molybdopterin dinucleotide binding domain-containing protein, partial [Terriglobales bacterium]|nr:molybdopterin dinucleotide binding domain-containing protein [Terriglobales bacterium]
VAQSFPWKKFEDVLRAGAQGLHQSGRGYIASVHAEEALRNVLEREGYWVPEFKDFDSFWNALLERGAWWDPTSLPVSRTAMLQTPSGKFEFYSSALKQVVDKAVREDGMKSSFISALAMGKPKALLTLPAVAIPDAVQPLSLPLQLNSYRLMTRPMGGGRNQPWLLEQPAVHVAGSWESWIEVHPETAAALGIKDGDWVWVESAKGRIKLQAKLYSGTRTDVVNVPLYGDNHPNINDLIASETDISRGFGPLNTTAVRIRRA